jgi:hypothetical protein
MMMSLQVLAASLVVFVQPEPTALRVPSLRAPSAETAVIQAARRGALLSSAAESVRFVPSLAAQRATARHLLVIRGSRSQPPLSMRHVPGPSKAMAVFALAVAGCWAGAHVGAALEGDGGDSPGLRGALIGMPVGGVLGAVLGWKLVR